MQIYMYSLYSTCICVNYMFTVDSGTCYSPEDLFFLKDQVSPGDQEGPKSEKQEDRERKTGML